MIKKNHLRAYFVACMQLNSVFPSNCYL